MKATQLYAMIALFFAVRAAQAQTTTNQKIQKQIDSTGNFNMLDAQAGIIGDLFGASNPSLAGVTDYKALLNRTGLDAQTKERYLIQYDIHRLSLDPTKKDSLNIQIKKMLEKAKAEGERN